jgi:hypothetical protein
MQRYLLRGVLLPVEVGWGIWVVLGLAPTLAAQDAQARGPVFFQSATASTPLSSLIDAQAQYLVAYGECEKSLAVARKINAEAYQSELHNWVDEVDAYFKRRELNRSWRRKENPGATEHEALRLEKLDLELRGQFERFVEGDVAGRMNWLLTTLSSPAIGVQYLSISQSEPVTALNRRISDEAKQQIWITDGGRKGKQLICRLSDGQVLNNSPWPPGLRRPECDAARAEYDAAMQQAKKEIQAHQPASYTSHRQCVDSLNTLFVTLEHLYPREDRQDTTLFFEYNAAKNYLRSLMIHSGRILSTNNPGVFSGSLRFEGQSVGDLIQYMTERGLLFAPPHEGEEGTYKGLLTDLSSVYAALSPLPTAPAPR